MRISEHSLNQFVSFSLNQHQFKMASLSKSWNKNFRFDLDYWPHQPYTESITTECTTAHDKNFSCHEVRASNHRQKIFVNLHFESHIFFTNVTIVYVELSYTSYIIINVRAMAVRISSSMILPYPALVTSHILTFSRKVLSSLRKKTMFRPSIFRVSFLWWLDVGSRHSSEFFFLFLHDCSSTTFNLWALVLTSYLSIFVGFITSSTMVSNNVSESVWVENVFLREKEHKMIHK